MANSPLGQRSLACPQDTAFSSPVTLAASVKVSLPCEQAGLATGWTVEPQQLAEEQRAGGSRSNAIQSRKLLPKAMASRKGLQRGPQDAQCPGWLSWHASSECPVKQK